MGVIPLFHERKIKREKLHEFDDRNRFLKRYSGKIKIEQESLVAFGSVDHVHVLLDFCF